MSGPDPTIAGLASTKANYIPVKNAFTLVSTARGIKRELYGEGSLVPIVDQGQGHIAGYTDDKAAAIEAGEYIVFGDHTRAIKWVDFSFAVGADGTKVLRPKEFLVPKFAFHALARLDIPSRGYNRHWAVLSELRIPVPSLDVQRAIVRILDTYMELGAELDSQLTAEQEIRHRQFGHHRKAIIRSNSASSWFTLGELTENHDRHRRPVSRDRRRPGPFPYYGANGIQDSVEDYIFDGTYLLVGEDGSVTRPDGSPVLNWATGKIWVNNHAHVLAATSSEINLRYIYHYLGTEDISARVSAGAQPKLTQRSLSSIPIPVPPREEQDLRTNTLDTLEVSFGELQKNLSAERAARRGQYEYHRDRLLTFEEAP